MTEMLVRAAVVVAIVAVALGSFGVWERRRPRMGWLGLAEALVTVRAEAAGEER